MPKEPCDICGFIHDGYCKTHNDCHGTIIVTLEKAQERYDRCKGKFPESLNLYALEANNHEVQLMDVCVCGGYDSYMNENYVYVCSYCQKEVSSTEDRVRSVKT